MRKKWKEPDFHEVAQSYSDFLLIRYPTHHTKFQERLKVDPDACIAEATVFSSLLRMPRPFCGTGLTPEVSENLSTGGADFLCHPPGREKFFVEVTSLDSAALSRKTNMPNTLEEGGGSFRLPTAMLLRKACAKVRQLAGSPYARVLSITSTHIGASAFFGAEGARCLLFSEPKIKIPLDANSAPAEITDLEKSVFFRFNENGEIVKARESISAILLVAMSRNLIEVYGVLHPDPIIPLDTGNFPEVPFLCMKSWPVSGEVMEAHWVVRDPGPAAFYLRNVEPTSDELKGAKLPSELGEP